MKPGDLRQFKDGLTGSARTQSVAGRPVMILEVGARRGRPSWVSFLVDGRIERCWGGDWVESNSETIDESR